jgi:hypothetical protein
MKNFTTNLLYGQIRNIVIKLLVATIMIALKLLLTSFVIWVTGLFLIGYLTNLPYMNFLQSLAVVLWIKIILFNLTPKKSNV